MRIDMRVPWIACASSSLPLLLLLPAGLGSWKRRHARKGLEVEKHTGGKVWTFCGKKRGTFAFGIGFCLLLLLLLLT